MEDLRLPQEMTQGWVTKTDGDRGEKGTINKLQHHLQLHKPTVSKESTVDHGRQKDFGRS